MNDKTNRLDAGAKLPFPSWRFGAGRNTNARGWSVSDFVLRISFVIVALLLLAGSASGDTGRIYTPPDATASGGIEGTADIGLTHALAIDHERLRVYRAELTDVGKSFRFEHLPVGKYNLVLVTKGRAIYEGLALGDTPAKLPPVSSKNLATRVAVADSFFNRHLIHRIGIDGDRALVFAERIRDKPILKQSGEKLADNLRRLEIIELEESADDWQMIATRHIYREEEPIEANPPFMKHCFVSGLGNIRVVDSVKQLGALSLPKN